MCCVVGVTDQGLSRPVSVQSLWALKSDILLRRPQGAGDAGVMDPVAIGQLGFVLSFGIPTATHLFVRHLRGAKYPISKHIGQ